MKVCKGMFILKNKILLLFVITIFNNLSLSDVHAQAGADFEHKKIIIIATAY